MRLCSKPSPESERSAASPLTKSVPVEKRARASGGGVGTGTTAAAGASSPARHGTGGEQRLGLGDVPLHALLAAGDGQGAEGGVGRGGRRAAAAAVGIALDGGRQLPELRRRLGHVGLAHEPPAGGGG